MTSTEPEIFHSRFDDEGLRGAVEGMFSLYADPYVAALREYAANALDAHREAGVDAPVEVEMKLDRTGRPGTGGDVSVVYLRVTDHGAGMALERLAGVFAHYVGSDKRSDQNQVGGFGIGAKAALATGDFTVRTRHKGRTAELAVHYNGEDIINFMQDAPTPREADGTTIDARLFGITDDGWERLLAYAKLLAATSGAHITASDPLSTHTFARPVGDALYDAASSVAGVHVYPFGTLLNTSRDAHYVALHGVPYRVELTGAEMQRAGLTLAAEGLIPVLTWDEERHSMPRSRDIIRGVDLADLPVAAGPIVRARTEDALIEQVSGGEDAVAAYRRAWEFADSKVGPYGEVWFKRRFVRSRDGEVALLNTLIGSFPAPVSVLSTYGDGTAAFQGAHEAAPSLLESSEVSALGLAVLPEKVAPPRSGTAALSVMVARGVAAGAEDDPTRHAVTSDPRIAAGLAEAMALLARFGSTFGDEITSEVSRRVRIFTEQEVADARSRGRSLRTYDGEVVRGGEWEPVSLTAAQWRDVVADPHSLVSGDRDMSVLVPLRDARVETEFGVAVTRTLYGRADLTGRFTVYHLPTTVPGVKRAEIAQTYKAQCAPLVEAERARLESSGEYDRAEAAEAILTADGLLYALRDLDGYAEWLSEEVTRLAEHGKRHTGRSSYSLRGGGRYGVVDDSPAVVAAVGAVKAAASAAHGVFRQSGTLAKAHPDAYGALARTTAALVEQTVAEALAARPVGRDYAALVAAATKK